MRLWTLAMAAALPSVAASQAGLAGALAGLNKALGPKSPTPASGAKSPAQGLQPSGFPGLPERDPSLPAPAPGGAPRLRVLSGETFERKGDFVALRGGVHAQYKGYDIYGNVIDGNLQTSVFRIAGRAKLVGLDAVIEAEWIEVDFENETYRAGESFAQLRPSLTKGRTVDDLYVWGRESDGSNREVHTHDGGLTTCNLDEPHFRLLNRSSVTRPNKRVILRSTAIEVLGRTILRIPYLSIPIDNRRERYTPEVGQSQTEGYYIKTRWGVPVPGDSDVDAYLDYYEKLGTGYGGRLGYDSARSRGYLKAYAIAGQQNSFELISEHEQLFGNSRFSLTNNYQRSNVFNAPQNTILNTRAQLLIPQAGATTRFTYLRYANESPGFQSVNQTWGLSDQRSWSERTKSTLDVKWTSSKSSFSSGNDVEREQIDLRLRASHDFKKALADLEYTRAIPVGETSNFFGSSDRTPVLAIKTDSKRLFGDALDRWFRFNTELSVGEFANPSAKDRVTRTFFDFNFSRPDPGRTRAGLGLMGRFRQGIYSDDTAQYAVDANASFRYSLGTNVGWNVRYSYLKPQGFTPLAIDRVGNKQLISTDLSFNLGNDLLLGAQTGYDYRAREEQGRSKWQQIAVRIEWRPEPWFLLRALPTYDPFLEQWTNIRLDLGWAAGDTFINLGARYDGLREQWGQVNAFVDGLKVGRTKFTGLAAYNGYLRKFESTQFSVTYDLHCWEAVLQVIDNSTGFRPGTQVVFFFRLKALPFDSNFGVGTRGQPIGTGTGVGF